MKEKDKSQVKKIAEDIVTVVKRRNLANIGEHLGNFLVQNPHADELTDRLMDGERAAALENAVKCRDKQNDIEHLIEHLAELKVTRRNKIRRYVMAGTATAAAIITACFVIFNDTPHNTTETSIPALVMTKPLLVMASGEKVVVEAENNKIVAADFIDTKESVGAITKNRLIIPSKNMFTVVLDDGTEVTLNAQSELEYPSKFTGDSREVRVHGEAYFNVTKSDVPFIVKIGDGEIKVYGTSFNIRERENNSIETILISGSVGVKYQNCNEVMIKPNQRIVINAKEYTIEEVDASQYIGWLTNAFQYFNTDALTVIKDIEKWYGIEIVNSSKKLNNNEKISFNIDRNYSIPKIISLLEKALSITIIDEGGDRYSIK